MELLVGTRDPDQTEITEHVMNPRRHHNRSSSKSDLLDCKPVLTAEGLRGDDEPL